MHDTIGGLCSVAILITMVAIGLSIIQIAVILTVIGLSTIAYAEAYAKHMKEKGIK